MSESDQMVLKIPLSVSGIPDDVRVTTQPVDQLTVTLSGRRSDLLRSGKRGRNHVIRINSSAFNVVQGHASLPTQRLRDSIVALVVPQVTIRLVEPDSVVYDFARQHTVSLPVVYDGIFESEDQYFLERIDFMPDSVMASVITSDTMKYNVCADIESISLYADTTVRMVSLRPIPGVILSTSDVQMTVIAQQYTEKTIEVPVTGVNFPENVMLKAFPSKAVISAWVKMSEYDKVGAADFRVVVDYDEIAGRDNAAATLRVIVQPANVRNVRLQTSTVDYLIETRAE